MPDRAATCQSNLPKCVIGSTTNPLGRAVLPRFACRENIPHGCPLHTWITVIVERLQFGASAEHVVHVLHALPGRIECAAHEKNGARDLDQSRLSDLLPL